MTLVYAKIIDMFVCGGQTQGVGGRGLVGGTWKFPKLSQRHGWLCVGSGGVWEWGNDEGGEGGGEGGWGEALIEVLNKTGIVTSD